MTPSLRRALHQALDLVLDAIAEDARNDAPKRRKRPALAKPLPPLPANIDPEVERVVNRQLERAGFRKAG